MFHTSYNYYVMVGDLVVPSKLFKTNLAFKYFSKYPLIFGKLSSESFYYRVL